MSAFFHDQPPQPNCLFVPQSPSHLPSCSSARQLVHLQVGLLNVAWQGAKEYASELPSPPMTQALTLPLMLNMHPGMLAPSSSPSTDSAPPPFVPPTLRRLHTAVLPSILRNLTSMIAQVKVKKLETMRGNRVGIMRNQDFVFTFTFKETTPPYHLLTVAARRIRRQSRDEKTPVPDATAPPARRAGYSLSSHLTDFDLFSSPHTRVHLLPIRRSNAAHSPDAIEGDGYYQGAGYASYLVSRHTLHVRMMPTRRALDQMDTERRAEQKRRDRMERPLATRRTRRDDAEADTNRSEANPSPTAQSPSNHDDDDDDFDLDSSSPPAPVGSKRKQIDSSSAAPKRPRQQEPDAALATAASTVGVGELDPPSPSDHADAEVIAFESLAEDESDFADWLNETA